MAAALILAPLLFAAVASVSAAPVQSLPPPCIATEIRQTRDAIVRTHAERAAALRAYRLSNPQAADSIKDQVQRWRWVRLDATRRLDENAVLLCRWGRSEAGRWTRLPALAQRLASPPLAAKSSETTWDLAVCLSLETRAVDAHTSHELSRLMAQCRAFQSRWIGLYSH